MHCNNLDEVRANIDRIDSAIIALIAECVSGRYLQKKRGMRKRLITSRKSNSKSAFQSQNTWRRPRYGRKTLPTNDSIVYQKRDSRV